MNDKPTVEEISNLANPDKFVQGNMNSIVIEPPTQETVDRAIEVGLLPEDAQLVESRNEFMTATINNVTEDTPIPTWELNGKKYFKYLFDGYGTQVLPIIENGETLGEFGAKFHWEKSAPFLEALDQKNERITDFKTQATKTKSRNANIALAKLFREIVVDGFISEIDEFGNKTKTEMNAKELISELPQEFQSKLVFEFINALNVERYYKPGSSKLKQLMKPDDGSIFFLCTLGQFAWLIECAVPNLDARRAYEDSIIETEKTNEEKAEKAVTIIRYDYKMRFAKKYFRDVQGISLETEGQDFDSTNNDHIVKFKSFMPATWWVVLADKLAMCFDKAGK